MAGQLQLATATAGVPACIKMIKHPVLQLPNCSWDFAAVESHHEKYIQCCNSVSVLFRPTNLPCELKRNEVYRPNSSFFSLPGCNPFLLSVTGNFQCSGIEISILHGINLWGLLSNCFPGCEQLEEKKKKIMNVLLPLNHHFSTFLKCLLCHLRQVIKLFCSYFTHLSVMAVIPLRSSLGLI